MLDFQTHEGQVLVRTLPTADSAEKCPVEGAKTVHFGPTE
jgi:hypothetical protein